MALRRRKRDDEARTEEAEAVEAAEGEDAEAARPAATGPYDEADAPEDDGIPRIDLGALRVPVFEGLEIQLDTAPDGSVRAVLVSERDAILHLIVVAAPRSEGIWDEVRQEIAESVRADGGKAEEVEGAFGTELTARVPSEGRLRPARFIGVDGPRWFLRGLFQGPAASDPRRAARLEELFRNLVVVRGPQPMPVRDSLPMQVPSDAVPSETPEEDDDPDAPRPLPMPERGPEITETR